MLTTCATWAKFLFDVRCSIIKLTDMKEIFGLWDKPGSCQGHAAHTTTRMVALLGALNHLLITDC